MKYLVKEQGWWYKGNHYNYGDTIELTEQKFEEINAPNDLGVRPLRLEPLTEGGVSEDNG